MFALRNAPASKVRSNRGGDVLGGGRGGSTGWRAHASAVALPTGNRARTAAATAHFVLVRHRFSKARKHRRRPAREPTFQAEHAEGDGAGRQFPAETLRALYLVVSATDSARLRNLDPRVTKPRVLIIGAGIAGLCMGQALDRAAVPFTIFEKAGELGGTWRDNVYPGAGCDVPSHLYCYSFHPNPDFTRAFAEQSEILSYLRG